MLHTTRVRLSATALIAAALPLVLRMGAAAGEATLTPIPDSYSADDDTMEQRSPCGCGRGNQEENDTSPFEVVRFLHPRWSEESADITRPAAFGGGGVPV